MIKSNLIIFLLISFFTLITIAADTNEYFGFECSLSDNSTSENSFKTNLRNLLNSLAGKSPTQAAFFTEKSDSGELYGRAQCRADVPAAACAACIRNATDTVACPASTNVTVWQRWCILRYANAIFFGAWDKSAMATANETNFEDPEVVTEGMRFMTKLAATAAERRLMFATAEMDAGEKGRRYGMAQCSRDIRRRDCGACFGSLLATFRSTIGNKRGWEIYGSSCSMWYHDFQFYFNYTIPNSNHGYGNFPPHFGISGIIINGLVFYLFMLIN